VAVLVAATGVRLRAVMGGMLIVIRVCHRNRFPAVRRPLNNIP
jgi:hypothetical protein